MTYSQELIDQAAEHIKDELAACEPCTTEQLEAAVLTQCIGATEANYSPLTAVALGALIQAGSVVEWEQYPECKVESGASWASSWVENE
jgi:hypothetical protein